MGYVSECARYVWEAGNVGSVTVPVTAAVGVGKTVVVAVNAPALSAITNFTITDTKGNAWNQRAFVQSTTLVNGQGAVFTCHPTTALTTTDTLTVTAVTRSPDRWCVLGLIFDDILTTSATDQTATNAGAASASMTVGPTAVTTQAAELVFSAFTITGAVVVTAGSGFTAQAALTASPAAAPKSLFVQWKYVTATGAQTPTATLNSSQTWTGMVVTLKKAAVATVYDRFVVKAGAWSPATAVFG